MSEDKRLSRRDLLRAAKGAAIGAAIGAVLPDSCASESNSTPVQQPARQQPQPQPPKNKKPDPNPKKQQPQTQEEPQSSDKKSIPIGRRMAGGAVVGALTALVLKRRDSGRVAAEQEEQQAGFEEGREAEWHWKRTGDNTDPDRRQR